MYAISRRAVANSPTGSNKAQECPKFCQPSRTGWVGGRKSRRVHEERCPLAPGNRDIESVAVEKELHAARDVLGARGGHRHDDDWGLLTLELIDGSNASVSESGGIESI